MQSQEIVDCTLASIATFIRSTFGDTVADKFEQRINNEAVIWPHIKEWLKQTQFTHDWKTILVEFVQTLPDYESFGVYFRDSLLFHESFWFQVFEKLALAAKKLTKE